MAVSALPPNRSAPASYLDTWKKLKVDTTLSVTVKNTGKEPIFLSRRTSLDPGEAETFVITNFTMSASIASLSGHLRPGGPRNNYSIDVTVQFGDDIEYAPGIWVGLFCTDGL